MCTFKTLSDGYKLFRVNPKNYFLIGMVLLALVTLLAREAHALALYASDTGINYFVDSGQSIAEEPSWDVALGDLDHDGDLDAVTANGSGFVSDVPDGVWMNDGQGIFSPGLGFGDSISYAVALGDFDGDGDLDAFIGISGYSDGDSVWLNDGSGVFSDTGQLLGTGNSNAVALGDLDGDQDLDAVVAHNWGGPSQIWLNDGSGSFTENGQVLDSGESNDVALGDLDSDGDLDIFFANGSSFTIGRNRVWFNNGSANFVDSGQNLGTSDSQGVALADLDGDGDLDAFVANKQGILGQANRIWLNDGAGFFTDGLQELGNSRSTDVGLSDIDLDGDYDAVVANEHDPKEVWLNDGLGNFSISQELSSFNTQGLAIGDLNQDNKPDLFFANIYACDFVCLGFPNEVWLNQLHKQYLAFIQGP